MSEQRYNETLVSGRKDGKLANSDNIFDKDRGKMQSDINKEMKTRTDNSFDSLKQTKQSAEDGGENVITLTRHDGTSEQIKFYNGSKGSKGDKGEKGDKGDQGEIGPQGNSGIADASNKVLVNDAITGGETDFLSAEVGKLGILTYDCSKGGTVTHATLQDAINSVPTTFQKVGLTITYKSGNTIYRYTLKANAWSADPANWFSVENKLSDLKHGEIINGTNNNTFFKKSAFTEVVGAPTTRANYYFGRGLDEEPDHVPDEPNACKYEITLLSSNQPLYIYLEGCTSANCDYRTWAVFHGDNNAIVSEGVCDGDKVLTLPYAGKYTILATCKRILQMSFIYKFPSIYNALSNLQDSINYKFNKSDIVQETGYATDKVMSQKTVSSKLSDLKHGEIINGTNNNTFFKKSAFTEVVGAPTTRANYYFGRGLDEEPDHVPDEPNACKYEITLLSSNQPLYIYLEGCTSANCDYRTWAVFHGDNNAIVSEGVCDGDKVLTLPYAGKYTILATCKRILQMSFIYKFPSIYNALSNLQDSIKARPLSLIAGKTFWTIFDSLGHNTWQKHFVDISGAIFHFDLNTNSRNPISFGGTNSLPSSDDSTQPRAMNLVSYKNKYPIDYVFIENINDRGYGNFGKIEDTPFMRTQKVRYTNGEIFNDHDEALSYFQNHRNEIISTVSEKRLGTIISIPYQSGSSIRGSKVKFLTKPTSEGDVVININGSYSIHVVPSMTIQDIVDEFTKYSYGQGWSDVDNGDGSISIFYYTETSKRATFDGGSTGVTAEITDATGSGSVNIHYIGESIDEVNWNNADNWIEWVSLFSIYKGLIEYLQTELPQAKLYWVAPFSVGIDFASNTYKKADGTWSQDKYLNSDLYKKNRKLYEVQKTVCEHYNIPFLDLDSLSGMSILNIETFFYTNNVHPKENGYNRYAETILTMIQK